MSPRTEPATRPARREPPRVGVDGCRGGWVAAHRVGERVELELLVELVPFLDSLGDGALVGIDIPIGLLDRPTPGGRNCDRATRQVLGARASSVFSAPCRAVLDAREFAETRGLALTLQAFHLLPKIREVDRWISPERQHWVREFHPELCFTRLLGSPASRPKRERRGREERLSALPEAYAALARATRPRFPSRSVALDDVVDALGVLAGVDAWEAGAGMLFPEPAEAQLDARGLTMQIQG